MKTLVTICVAAALCGPARADDPSPEQPEQPAPEQDDEPTPEQRAEATRLLEKGNALYEAGDYDKALEAYQAAFEQTGAPGFLYNIAQTYRLQGDCVDAQNHYEQFLDAAPQTERKTQVEELIAEMQKCVQERRARLLANQPESSDGGGGDSVGGATGRQQDLPPTGKGLRTFGLITMAGGLALGGVGVVFALDAGSKSDELDGFSGEWSQGETQTERAGKRSRRAAIALFASGSAAVAGGVVMYILGSRQSSEPAGTVTLDITDSGAAIGFSGRF